MPAPVQAVDDQIGLGGELIGDPLGSDATDDRLCPSPWVEDGQFT